jgi:4-amino-4-deoxy-L-arabinose transferase-like glycosyltransferase
LSGIRVPPEWHRFERRPWYVGQMLLYRSGYDARRILLYARLPVIALFLALSCSLFAFVRVVGGSDIAALSAMSLSAFCPTLLAHGHLATVDMGLTLFSFAAIALTLRVLEESSTSIAVLAGVSAACAAASKVSGAIVPLFILMLVAFYAVRGRVLPWRSLFVAGLSSVITFAAIYLAVSRGSNPFTEYLREIRNIHMLYAGGYNRPQFLLGEFSRHGWWYYDVIALLLKMTLPALLLIVIATIVAIWQRRRESLALLAFALLFLAVSSFSSLAIGVRHVLPIFPFVFAAIGISLSDPPVSNHDERRAFGIAVATLIAWHAGASLLAYPSYISYFNPLIGNQRNADRYLVDSNLDWGQDLHRLALWTREHKVDFIRVNYFGAGDIGYEFGARAASWPAPRPQSLPKGWFAVSRHYYRLSFDRSFSAMDYDTYLARSHAQYVTTVGGSIYVYRVP